ncbi:hypothetical protein H5073_05625 [Shewanella sp. SR44-3]|nr:hypothetical protein [Shewanella sp. SR44-3]
MHKVMKKFVLLPAVVALVMALMACDSGSVQAITETEANIETEAEISICDEFGNRYSSEDEPKAKGLELHQYGATYCPEYKPELN